jgi:hypothetical protein
MAQGITKVADMTNSVTTVYEKEYYLLAAQKPGVWGQFVDWMTPISSSGGGGSSYNFPVYGELDPVESYDTNEDADIVPQKMSDGYTTVTPRFYRGLTSTTKLLRLQSRTDLDKLAAEEMTIQRVNSLDRILRRSACGYGSSYPTQTIHIDGSVAMLDLTAATSTDNVTYAFLMDLAAYAASMGIEPYSGGGFIAPVHPLLFAEIKGLTEYKSMGYYQDEQKITGGLEKPITLAGITFVPTLAGRLYLGSGDQIAGSAASFLDTAANKGATTLAVNNNSTLSAAIGDYVTIGTIETEGASPSTNLEQVKVTDVNSNTLTIRAAGVGEDFGLRFDHAAGAVVNCNYNVAAIPLIGKNSLVGVYSSEAGKDGKAIVDDTKDIFGLVKYYGWWWYGGLTAIQKRVVLGKVAISRWILGYN